MNSDVCERSTALLVSQLTLTPNTLLVIDCVQRLFEFPTARPVCPVSVPYPAPRDRLANPQFDAESFF
jgi:hypothetical protein